MCRNICARREGLSTVSLFALLRLDKLERPFLSLVPQSVRECLFLLLCHELVHESAALLHVSKDKGIPVPVLLTDDEDVPGGTQSQLGPATPHRGSQQPQHPLMPPTPPELKTKVKSTTYERDLYTQIKHQAKHLAVVRMKKTRLSFHLVMCTPHTLDEHTLITHSVMHYICCAEFLLRQVFATLRSCCISILSVW